MVELSFLKEKTLQKTYSLCKLLHEFNTYSDNMVDLLTTEINE